jgi:hypothetical protein
MTTTVHFVETQSPVHLTSYTNTRSRAFTDGLTNGRRYERNTEIVAYPFHAPSSRPVPQTDTNLNPPHNPVSTLTAMITGRMGRGTALVRISKLPRSDHFRSSLAS